SWERWHQISLPDERSFILRWSTPTTTPAGFPPGSWKRAQAPRLPTSGRRRASRRRRGAWQRIPGHNRRMPRDVFLPPSIEPPPTRPGLHWLACPWTPEILGELVAALREGGEALRSISTADLLEAWADAVEVFRDPASPERQGLDPELARLCRLSPEGLSAGLEAVLGGVRRDAAGRLLEAAEAHRAGAPREPVLVVLASNLPGLAVQPLLPALALRRPVLLKSPSAEPLFAASFLAALAQREPRLAGAVAAVAWPGGDPRLEAPVLAGVG